MTEVARLVPTKSDAELAAEYKKRAADVYQAVLELCTEAQGNGFEVHIASGMGALGKHVITMLKVVKVY